MIHKAPCFKHKNYIGYLVMPCLESQKHRQSKAERRGERCNLYTYIRCNNEST